MREVGAVWGPHPMRPAGSPPITESNGADRASTPETDMADSNFSSLIPDTAPPEVLAEVDAAWERSAALVGDGIDLHVRVGRISGRVRGELRVEDAVVARLIASQVLALACGDPLPLPRP